MVAAMLREAERWLPTVKFRDFVVMVVCLLICVGLFTALG